jgi:hypothetical protein
MNPPIDPASYRWTRPFRTPNLNVLDGAIAQLVERLHGMQEVGGSIPPGSTKLFGNLNFHIFHTDKART